MPMVLQRMRQRRAGRNAGQRGGGGKGEGVQSQGWPRVATRTLLRLPQRRPPLRLIRSRLGDHALQAWCKKSWRRLDGVGGVLPARDDLC